MESELKFEFQLELKSKKRSYFYTHVKKKNDDYLVFFRLFLLKFIRLKLISSI